VPVDRSQVLLAVRYAVRQMSDEQARRRFDELKSRYLIGDESEEVLLLAERLGEQGEIWTFDFRNETWRRKGAQGDAP